MGMQTHSQEAAGQDKSITGPLVNATKLLIKDVPPCNRVYSRVARLGILYLMGVHLTGVHLMSVHLTGVHLIDVYETYQN
jgi:hypothetical protein